MYVYLYSKKETVSDLKTIVKMSKNCFLKLLKSLKLVKTWIFEIRISTLVNMTKFFEKCVFVLWKIFMSKE